MNMASNNNNTFSCYYEEPILEKLPACTMKRYPKMDLNKSDMLQLLSYLEGELQARDVVVAALNAEKMKQMTLRAKRHRAHPEDPLFALQRDSEIMRDCSFGEMEVKAMYDDQLNKLENLISVQHAAQKNMRDILTLLEKKYHKMCMKLDIDRKNHSKDVEQDQHIVRLLEKEKERLIDELEKERKRYKYLEEEVNRCSDAAKNEAGSNSDNETLIAVQLIKEQTRMMRKMADLKSYAASLTEEMEEENRKVAELEKSISEETGRLMHEEALQEKRLSEFDFERQQLLARLSKAEAQQKELLEELSKLQQQNEATDGSCQAEFSRGEQNGKASNLSTMKHEQSLKFFQPAGLNQSQISIKRPSSAQPIPSKLQPPIQIKQHQSPQPNLPRNFTPSAAPNSAMHGLQQSRIRAFGNEFSPSSVKAPTSAQNFQGPLIKRALSSRAPPPVPSKPQIPVLPQVQQNTQSRSARSPNS